METQIRPSDGDVVKDSNDAPDWHSTQFPMLSRPVGMGARTGWSVHPLWGFM